MDVDTILRIAQLPWYILVTLAFFYTLRMARKDCQEQIAYLRARIEELERKAGILPSGKTS